MARVMYLIWRLDEVIGSFTCWSLVICAHEFNRIRASWEHVEVCE